MRLLVYEHVSGGGCADESLQVGILSEGFGMLRGLISDFKSAGHSVTTMLDSRIARLNPPVNADCLVPVFSSREARVNLRKLVEKVDAVCVIAPEADGLLQSLVELVEQMGAASLNCQASAIEKVSDKAAFHEFMKKLGLSLPPTRLFRVADDLNYIQQTIRDSLRFPVVFKPSIGVSCGGLSVVGSNKQVADAVEKLKQESTAKEFLVQELISGAAASVSLLSTGNDAVPISLNQQDVTIETPEACSRYIGGLVPFDHPLKLEAFEVAKKLVKSVPGLRGYVGVDFVLTDESAVAIEVNPRLTTSYVGLRSFVNFNPAQAIVEAVLKQELPAQVQGWGCTIFSKVEMHNSTLGALQKTYGIDDVVSPPFLVADDGNASALIASHSTTLNNASARFRETKKRVLNTIRRGE